MAIIDSFKNIPDAAGTPFKAATKYDDVSLEHTGKTHVSNQPTDPTTGALQTAANTRLVNIDGKTPALGQALAADSAPVVLTAVQVTALTPPAAITGFSTAANQATSNTSLATIATNTGNNATAANQTTTNTSLATIATNTSSNATAANQATSNTSLATIATNTGNNATAANQSAAATLTGPVTETAPTTDIASSGLNGRLQRIAQRVSSLIALFPGTLGTNGGLRVDQVSALDATNDHVDMARLAGITPPADAVFGLGVKRIPVGSHANAWSAVAVLAAGVSTVIDTQYDPSVAAFGNAGAATTITVQLSQDNTNFYDSQLTQVLAGAGNFCILASIAARYVRLKSSAAATITATITAKG